MKIELGDDGYRIVSADGGIGDVADYGDAALLETGGKVYGAFLDDPETPWDGCEVKIYRLEPVATETEEVDFEETDDTDDGSGDGGDDSEDGEDED